MKLETRLINSNYIIIQKTEDNMSICGSRKYLDLAPLILREPKDFDLIKLKDPNQELLYDHSRKWTIDEAKLYLNALLDNSDLLSNTSMLEIARYRIEDETSFSKVSLCEGFRTRNLVSMPKLECTNCGNIELSDKCAYCPIGFRCPVCSCIDKENVCYMHQAECIAALIIAQKKEYSPGWALQILIPDSWVIKFGDNIYKKVRNIREIIYNVYYTSDLMSNIRVTVDESENDLLQYLQLKYLLSFTPLRYRENGIIIDFNVDKNTLESIKSHLPSSIIYHEEVEDITSKPFDEMFYVKGISFGNNDSGADIIDDGNNETLGDPRNQYTYSILCCMNDYINSNTEKVLDIGCGRGTTSIYAKKCGAQYLDSIDIDYKACIETKLMFEKSSEFMYLYTRTNIIKEDVFEFINYSGKYDVIIGNLHYDIQKDLLPKISSILKPGGIYIAGGIPILIEYALLNIKHDLELIDSRYFYNSTILIFQKRKEVI